MFACSDSYILTWRSPIVLISTEAFYLHVTTYRSYMYRCTSTYGLNISTCWSWINMLILTEVSRLIESVLSWTGRFARPPVCRHIDSQRNHISRGLRFVPASILMWTAMVQPADLNWKNIFRRFRIQPSADDVWDVEYSCSVMSRSCTVVSPCFIALWSRPKGTENTVPSAACMGLNFQMVCTREGTPWRNWDEDPDLSMHELLTICHCKAFALSQVFLYFGFEAQAWNIKVCQGCWSEVQTQLQNPKPQP